jgi:hypothetical protein
LNENNRGEKKGTTPGSLLGHDMRMIFDLIPYRYVLIIPTCSINLLVHTRAFELRGKGDRIRYIKAFKSVGQHLVERKSDGFGSITTYAPKRLFEVDFVNGNPDDVTFYAKEEERGDPFKLSDVRFWFHNNGAPDAMVKKIQFYSDHYGLTTTWESLMLHRHFDQSGWKKMIVEFHKKFHAKVHPAALSLRYADIRGDKIPTHDPESIKKHILPTFASYAPMEIIDLQEKDRDYHDNLVRMLKAMGAL